MIIDDIISSGNCCGCGACAAVCPRNCISMKNGNGGFLFPEINREFCINCNKCENVCIVYNNDFIIKNNFISVYACYSKDEQLLLSSSSGGVFPLLADRFLRNGGVVCGCALDKSFHAVHVIITETSQIPLLQGSKYIQSNNMYLIYEQIKKHLDKSVKVLFSGTPCQVNALNKYLKGNTGNLYTVDFICHGVPSGELYRKYINSINRRGNLEKIEFRNKAYGWKNFSVKCIFKDGRTTASIHYVNGFMNVFLSDRALRKSCYYCKSRGKKRSSDITLGDFWTVNNVLPNWKGEDGTSLVFINSHNGETLFDEIKMSTEYANVDYQTAALQNKSYNSSPKFPQNYNRIINDIDTMNIKGIFSKYGKSGTKRIIRSFYVKLKKTLKP